VVVPGEVVPSQFFLMDGSQVVVQVDVHEEQVEEVDHLVYLLHALQMEAVLVVEVRALL
jgi:hypothetical protein